ncbi:hypothetical protein HKD37_15G041954 [Glycine soja]
MRNCDFVTKEECTAVDVNGEHSDGGEDLHPRSFKGGDRAQARALGNSDWKGGAVVGWVRVRWGRGEWVR